MDRKHSHIQYIHTLIGKGTNQTTIVGLCVLPKDTLSHGQESPVVQRSTTPPLPNSHHMIDN